MKMLRIVLVFQVLSSTLSDILYQDFNETEGLIFNGDTGTTNCRPFKANTYGDVQGKADLFDEDAPIERQENTDLISESVMQTNLDIYNEEITTTLAGFLHRNDTINSPDYCSVRVRLTPSGPSKKGSMWFREQVSLVNGFDTYFTFQISDHSKECTLHKDQYFSRIHHRTCSIHGGDGFAFVIHNNLNATKAIGNVGGEMGFGGITDSLAIAFDTFSNPGLDKLGCDHVSIQSRGTDWNTGYDKGLLGVPRPYDLADGKVHLVRIAYFDQLMPEYFDWLVASDSLLPYLKDNGEQKRVGTLVIFLDDGVETNTPLMSMPINLSLLLKMPDDKAYVGFTSSTGRFYEKHDIVSWYYCDQQPCKKARNAYFDYHQRNKSYSAAGLRRFTPGPGYGGGDNTQGFPTKNEDPDTTPWTVPVTQLAAGRNYGLSPDSASQVPPNTLY